MEKQSFPDYKSCGNHFYNSSNVIEQRYSSLREFFCRPCKHPCFWFNNKWNPPKFVKPKKITNNILFLGDSTVRDLYWDFLATLRQNVKPKKCLSFSSENKFCKFSHTVYNFYIDFIFLDGSNVYNELKFINENTHSKYDTFLGCPIYNFFKENVYNYSKSNYERHAIKIFNVDSYIYNCGLYHKKTYEKGKVTILGQTPLPGWTKKNNSFINFITHNSLMQKFNLCDQHSNTSVIDRYGIVKNRTRDCIHPTTTANVAISKMLLASS